MLGSRLECTVLAIAIALAGRSQLLEAGPAAEIPPVAKGDLPDDTRKAIRQALPYLARQTNAWIEEKKCASCHQVPHALWAMNDARKAGFAIDDRLADWNRWAVAFVLNDKREAPLRSDEAYQLLLSRSTDTDPEPATARNRLASLLRQGRDADGNWQAGGRLPDQKRPKQENDEVTTMWSHLTLRAAGDVGTRPDAGTEHRRLSPTARSTSTEHLALRYLLARDGRETEAAALQEQIMAHQNEDGGWGWLLEGDSDALGTGQALYALSYIEPLHRGDAVRRAAEFLVRTQQQDGAWQVPGTLKEGDGLPYVVSNDWGTAWAIIGLTRTLDR